MASDGPKTYQGGCHCGAYKFSVTLEHELTTVDSCNCSICAKKGALWAHFQDGSLAPVKDQGEEALVVYQFGAKVAEHKFCPKCCTSLFFILKGKESLVNARALEGVVVQNLNINKFDGSALPGTHENSPYTGPDLKVEDGEKLYTGGCHCGAITVALSSKPLPEVEVKECNCSICTKDAYVFAYPNMRQVGISVSPDHPDALGEYQFGPKTLAHQFCNICGVPIRIRVLGPPKEFIERLSDAGKAMVAKKLEIMPINLRILEGVEWDSLKIVKDYD